MSENLRIWIDAVIQQRSWSWSIVGILYLLIGMVVRGWFLKPLRKKARQMESKVQHAVKKAYLQRSLLGWVLFYAPLVVLTVWWNRRGPSLSAAEAAGLAAGAAAYALSVVSHLQAFGLAALVVLHQAVQEKSAEALS